MSILCNLCVFLCLDGDDDDHDHDDDNNNYSNNNNNNNNDGETDDDNDYNNVFVTESLLHIHGSTSPY